ncbi:hypothetical protein FACS189425_04170 [Clostridia bacterium]|nr:hypothetical protein FACS189425_04170 [Clostridia bacterium]
MNAHLQLRIVPLTAEEILMQGKESAWDYESVREQLRLFPLNRESGEELTDRKTCSSDIITGQFLLPLLCDEKYEHYPFLELLASIGAFSDSSFDRTVSEYEFSYGVARRLPELIEASYDYRRGDDKKKWAYRRAIIDKWKGELREIEGLSKRIYYSSNIACYLIKERYYADYDMDNGYSTAKTTLASHVMKLFDDEISRYTTEGNSELIGALEPCREMFAEVVRPRTVDEIKDIIAGKFLPTDNENKALLDALPQIDTYFALRAAIHQYSLANGKKERIEKRYDNIWNNLRERYTRNEYIKYSYVREIHDEMLDFVHRKADAVFEETLLAQAGNGTSTYDKEIALRTATIAALKDQKDELSNHFGEIKASEKYLDDDEDKKYVILSMARLGGINATTTIWVDSILDNEKALCELKVVKYLTEQVKGTVLEGQKGAILTLARYFSQAHYKQLEHDRIRPFYQQNPTDGLLKEWAEAAAKLAEKEVAAQAVLSLFSTVMQQHNLITGGNIEALPSTLQGAGTLFLGAAQKPADGEKIEEKAKGATSIGLSR